VKRSGKIASPAPSPRPFSRRSAKRLYGINTQHNPCRASRLAWRTCRDDNGLLSALKPVDLPFEFGDLLLALGQGTRRLRDPSISAISRSATYRGRGQANGAN
jgi:hypothetical protein